MSVTNLTFGFPAYPVTLSGGSWESDFPVTRADMLPMSDIARSADATLASTQMLATLDTDRAVQCVGVAGRNFSVDAKMRITLRDEDDATLQASGWFDVWQRVYDPDDLEWGEPSFITLKPEVDQLDDLAAGAHVFDNAYYTSSVLIEIDDEANDDGYIEVSYLSVSYAYEMTVNMAPGAEEGFEARSRVDASSGGVRHAELRTKPRVLSFETTIPENERRVRFNNMHRALDLVSPVLVIQEPSGTKHSNQNRLFMHFRALDRATRLLGGYDKQRVQLEQAT